MNRFDVIHALRELGIRVPDYPKSTQLSVLCPRCSHRRKPGNQRIPCLSVNLEEGVYKCHNDDCDFSGAVGDNYFEKQTRTMKIKQYRKPAKAREEGILAPNRDVYEYLKSRGIPEEIAVRNNVGRYVDKEGRVWIVYNYLRNGELVNYQRRCIRDGENKDYAALKKEYRFVQGRECEPILYNYDRCLKSKIVIITEGVEDAMSWEAIGYEEHTSVNQGAPGEKDDNAGKKLQCLTNCWELFDNKEQIYIAVDQDGPGKRLCEELITRLGENRCYVVSFPEGCKDANETLMKHGADKLQECFNNAREASPEGIIYLADCWEEMCLDYYGELETGTQTYFEPIDCGYKNRKIFSWEPGQVNVWSGYDNEGKSAFLRFLCLMKSAHEDFPWAFYSPEGLRRKFYPNLIHGYIGKSSKIKHQNHMLKEEYELGAAFINENFFFVRPKEEYNIQGLLKRFDYLIGKNGVKGIVIDPYNRVLHMKTKYQRDDQYLVEFMGILSEYAERKKIIVNVVAHQKTPETVYKEGIPQDYPEPDKRRIKEGGEWGNTADNVLIIHQPYRKSQPESNLVNIITEKIKDFEYGVRGVRREMYFDKFTNRFYGIEETAPSYREVRPMGFHTWSEERRNAYQKIIAGLEERKESAAFVHPEAI